MRPRHKTPQTFSLWMVDVLCCSLGSVIILWLVHAKGEREKSAGLATKSSEVLRLEAPLVVSEQRDGRTTRHTQFNRDARERVAGRRLRGTAKQHVVGVLRVGWQGHG